jgi:hypothetical protein
METYPLIKNPQNLSVQQIRVRTNLRSGDSVEKCRQDLKKLKAYYQQLLDEARSYGIS